MQLQINVSSQLSHIKEILGICSETLEYMGKGGSRVIDMIDIIRDGLIDITTALHPQNKLAIAMISNTYMIKDHASRIEYLKSIALELYQELCILKSELN